MKYKLLIIGLLLIAIAGLPLMIFFFQQQQELRSRATAATVLYFSPSSTTTTPLQKQVGDTVAVDLAIDPGTNAVSTVKVFIKYDPSLFSATNDAFVVNKTNFPETIEGPIVDTVAGEIVATISIGVDPTKAIKTPTTIGTLTLTATHETGTSPTMISFGSSSQAFSVGSSDMADENVLATTTPTYVIITTPPTPTLAPTSLSITAFLHGIGAGGDNANPIQSNFSNKIPLHQTRNITVSLFDSNNQPVLTKAGTINYNSSNGNFTGIIDLGTSLAAGTYLVQIKPERFLQKRVTGIVTITPQTTTTIAPLAFVTGDADNNNALNILDYNMMINCYSDILPPVSCTEQDKLATDFTDDDSVNQIDYNLFLRELSVQSGD